MSGESYEEENVQDYTRYEEDDVSTDEESSESETSSSEVSEEDELDMGAALEFIDGLPDLFEVLGLDYEDLLQILTDLLEYTSGEMDEPTTEAESEYIGKLDELYLSMVEVSNGAIDTLAGMVINENSSSMIGPFKEAYELIARKGLIDVVISNMDRLDDDINRVRRGKKLKSLNSKGYTESLVESLSETLPEDKDSFSSDLLNTIIIFTEPDDDYTEDVHLYSNQVREGCISMMISRGYDKRLVKDVFHYDNYNDKKYSLLKTEGLPTLLVHASIDSKHKADAVSFKKIVEILGGTRGIDEILLISKDRPTSQTIKSLRGIEDGWGRKIKWSYVPHSTIIVNPTRHISYCEHKRVEEPLKSKILGVYGAEGIPHIFHGEPVCTYSGFNVGDLLMVLRNRRTQVGNSIRITPAPVGYRLVVEE